MNTADPFEDYLQKKKLEMLKADMRGDNEPSDESDEGDEPLILADDDPAVEQRLHDEMRDFFESGGSAGAELFTKVGGEGSSEVSDDDQAEEIRDALDEVFQAEATSPEVVPDSENFVEFFKQVQQSFTKAPRADQPAQDVVDEPTAPVPDEANAPVAPVDSGPMETPVTDKKSDEQPVDASPTVHFRESVIEKSDEPEVLEAGGAAADAESWPEAALASAFEAAQATPEAESDTNEGDVAAYDDFPSVESSPDAPTGDDAVVADVGLAAFGVDTAALAAEIEACEDCEDIDGPFDEDESVDPVTDAPDSMSDLNLAEILARPVESSELVERVNLLSRVVAKLTEGGKLDQSEILEVLVKSGVEF